MAEEREQTSPSGDSEIDRNVADLEQSGEKLEDTIRETKRDWESKQASESVPGAIDTDAERPDDDE